MALNLGSRRPRGQSAHHLPLRRVRQDPVAQSSPAPHLADKCGPLRLGGGDTLQALCEALSSSSLSFRPHRSGTHRRRAGRDTRGGSPASRANVGFKGCHNECAATAADDKERATAPRFLSSQHPPCSLTIRPQEMNCSPVLRTVETTRSKLQWRGKRTWTCSRFHLAQNATKRRHAPLQQWPQRCATVTPFHERTLIAKGPGRNKRKFQCGELRGV